MDSPQPESIAPPDGTAQPENPAQTTRGQTGTLLPWVLPLALLVAVVVAVLANTVIVGLVLLLLGYVGVPIAYTAYRRTRRELRAQRTR